MSVAQDERHSCLRAPGSRCFRKKRRGAACVESVHKKIFLKNVSEDFSAEEEAAAGDSGLKTRCRRFSTQTGHSAATGPRLSQNSDMNLTVISPQRASHLEH